MRFHTFHSEVGEVEFAFAQYVANALFLAERYLEVTQRRAALRGVRGAAAGQTSQQRHDLLVAAVQHL